MRLCSTCKLSKEEREFSNDLHSKQCKACRYAVHRRYYISNPKAAARRRYLGFVMLVWVLLKIQ